jgi:hypothetical protein
MMTPITQIIHFRTSAAICPKSADTTQSEDFLSADLLSRRHDGAPGFWPTTITRTLAFNLPNQTGTSTRVKLDMFSIGEEMHVEFFKSIRSE